MDQIIGAIRRYTGSHHAGITGHRVVIVAVHRGADPDERTILQDDASIGSLRADDVVEFAPLIRGADGRERRSFVTSDGSPDELASA